jgi:hypothetical protein
VKRAIIGTLVAVGALALAPMAFAQPPFIVIDQHSIDNTITTDDPLRRADPNNPDAPGWWWCASDSVPDTPGQPGSGLGWSRGWTADDVNDDDAVGPGQRTVLKFFSDLSYVQAACGAGQNQIWMPGGGQSAASDPGWIELFSIPDCPPGTEPCKQNNIPDWTQVPPHDFTDGWRNFFTAQEGLGTTGPDCNVSPFIGVRKPDGGCDPGAEVLMDKIPNTDSVGIDETNDKNIDDTEWAHLIGQLICSPVHDSDVQQDVATGQANLAGGYLGVVAIRLHEIRDHPLRDYPLLRISIEDPSSCFTALAATFQTLRATRYGKSVVLRWTTASEIETLGFNVYRSYKGKRIKLNQRLIPAASLLGGAAPYRYSFRARIASARLAATSRYWIQEVELDRTRNWYGPVRAVSAAARAISLP